MGKIILLFILVPFVALCAVLALMPREPSAALSPREDACWTARAAIREKLANPSAASFTDCKIVAASLKEEGLGRYVVRDVFEYPDAGGIMREHGYAVSVSFRDGKTFFTILKLN